MPRTTIEPSNIEATIPEPSAAKNVAPATVKPANAKPIISPQSTAQNVQPTSPGQPQVDRHEYHVTSDAMEEPIEDCIVVAGREEDYVDVISDNKDRRIGQCPPVHLSS